MDLLAGYASGDDSASGGDSPPPTRPRPSAAASQGSLFSSLPAPKLSGPSGGAGGTGRKVQWTVPIKAAALSAAAETDGDEDRPKKKSKSTKGSSLASLLPAPKNVLGPGNGGTSSLLGGGSAMGGTKIAAPGPAPASVEQPGAAHPAAAAPQFYNTNNLYKVDEHGNYAAEAYAAQVQTPYGGQRGQEAAPSGPVKHYNYFPQEHQVATPYQGTLETLQEAGASGTPGDISEGDSAVSFLQAELERERERHARLGKKVGKAPKIVNITQEKLKYVAPQASAAANAATNAFGPQYQSQLRQEAGAKGSKTARRKHQIGTLFHDMKMAELEALETKTKSQKSKAETARKYGW